MEMEYFSILFFVNISDLSRLSECGQRRRKDAAAAAAATAAAHLWLMICSPWSRWSSSGQSAVEHKMVINPKTTIIMSSDDTAWTVCDACAKY